MFYPIFSPADDPFVEASIIYLLLLAIFRDLVIGTVGRLSVDHRPVRRLSAGDRPTHFKLPYNEK